LTFLMRLGGEMLRRQGWLRQSVVVRASLSAAALIAAADPAVSLARRSTIDQILDELHAQEAFDLARALMEFELSLERLKSGDSAARQSALESLKLAARDDATMDVVLQVARAMALADGAPSPDAISTLTEIAATLGRPIPQLEVRPAAAGDLPRHVIVVGNEKGGTGKSTTAIHIAMGLVERGAKVACVDLDGRQATLSRFLANRAAARDRQHARLVVPHYRRVDVPDEDDESRSPQNGTDRLTAVLHELADHDAVVVDTPGHTSRMVSAAYSLASAVVTPINDSFIDVDALADIDIDRREVRHPSRFARRLLEEQDRRKLVGSRKIDWIVARNRVGYLDNRNTREMAALLTVLSERMQFRLQPGLSERLVFRGLFYRGLTLFDLQEPDLPRGSGASLQRARREVSELLDAAFTEEGRSTTVRTG